jgi:uncharacterized protein (TIGR00725 family)
MAVRPLIAVVGAGHADEATSKMAYDVGRHLARGGAIVICGGLGGVMEAVSKGVRDARGMVIGVLPGTSRREGNEHLTVGLATGMGRGRNTIIAISCDAMVAVSGAFGTLSEVAQALNHARPVVVLESWDLPLAGDVGHGLFHKVDSPEEAASLAISLAKERMG